MQVTIPASKTRSILICVDLQLGFLDEDSWGGNRNNKDALKNYLCKKLSQLGEHGAGTEIIMKINNSCSPQF